MVSFIKTHVPAGAKVYTDEFKAYGSLSSTYVHSTVNHSLAVYVAGGVHTNTIENFWSVLKRGLYGIYHQVSDKHLGRYLDEFAARFNNRRLDNSTKFENFLKEGESRLSYQGLIA